jgi:hypothetical protein
MKFRPIDLDNCILHFSAENFNKKKGILPDDSKWIRNKIHRQLYKLQQKIKGDRE